MTHESVTRLSSRLISRGRGDVVRSTPYRKQNSFSYSGQSHGAPFTLYTAKELVPIIIAAAVWGRKWQGKAVLCRCDNAAVVAVINSGKSKDALVMHLMRCLFFFQAVFSLSLHAVHLPGKVNVAADCLSRG